jgi:hypothetical protein
MRQGLILAIAVAGLAVLAPAASAQVYTENFDQGSTLITDLQTAGWFFQNNSSPVGTIGYFNGNTVVFPPQAGAGYLGVNFNSGSGVATISNWAVLPSMTIQNGDTFNFWTRTVDSPAFPDRLQVRLSTNGASTNVGTLATDVGDFTNLLLDINPSLTTSGYPNTWTNFNITVSGLSGPVTGRFAFRYFVTNGGPSGANSDYIGIDTLTITPVPEPTSLALLGIPAVGYLWKRRRAKKS